MILELKFHTAIFMSMKIWYFKAQKETEGTNLSRKTMKINSE
jgi:hypothetical protein